MEKPAYWTTNKIFINGECQKRLMIVFKTPPCRKVAETEKCFICGFEVHSRGVKDFNIVSQFKFLQDLIVKKNIEHIDILSSGSILDSKQINYEQVLKLIKEIKKINHIKSVLIEGRIEYCYFNKIKEIKKILGSIDLEYGIGLESWSGYIRNIILKKDLKLKDYKECLKKLTKTDIGACTYVLIGIPKLSLKNSLKETKNSIIKIVDLYEKYHCKGRIAIFPIFISPNTLLEDLYNQGKYKLITLTDIMGILLKIKNKIDFKKYPIFVGLDDEKISQERYVFPQNKKEEKILKIIKKFNITQEL
jgi:radical SAM enzyme (TIGR01210 family)